MRLLLNRQLSVGETLMLLEIICTYWRIVLKPALTDVTSLNEYFPEIRYSGPPQRLPSPARKNIDQRIPASTEKASEIFQVSPA